MVEMRMRQQHPLNLPAAHNRQQRLHIPTIHQPNLIGTVREDVSSGIENGIGDVVNVKHLRIEICITFRYDTFVREREAV